ncbi:MAG: SH3 domain-containing protein [Lachnospiraceae bacterium]|nr:SH3 domain-containing protein [Lachnospiraceae bacterium]
MKKRIVPVLIAVALIVITVAVGFGSGLIEKYSYSNERADLFEYFGVTGQNEAAIILGDELRPEKALVRGENYYLPLSFIKEKLDERFYYDYNEKLLIYTMPTDSVTVKLLDTGYTENGKLVPAEHALVEFEDDTVYVAVDYLRKFANFSYSEMSAPDRIQIHTEWGTKQTAAIKKNTQVRLRGGVKSEILQDVYAGDRVTVLEQLENWSKVKTEGSVIGYVENKRLEDMQEETETPVEDVALPEYSSLTKDYKINLVWNLVTNTDANANIDSYLQNTKGINTIAPTWFALSDNEGNFSSFADAAYVSSMHARGIEVWAMLDNFTNKGVDTKAVLSYTSKRKLLIDNLLSQVQNNGIDGINLDFEQIPQDAADDYIQFVRELSVACRLNGIIFSIDNYVPTGYTDHYNREEQGIVADYVVIMGYDEHWLGSSEPGSVASIDFVENGVADTVSVVPKEKVINALPFYTILWGTGEEVTSRALGMDAAQEHLASKGVSAEWDETTCQNYASYTEDNVLYQIWLEDEQSIETKLNMMKQYGIGGVAGWRLGLEKAAIWDKIEVFLQE